MSETPADRGIITTERLLLRPLSPSDSDSIFALRSDPQVYYWTTPNTREQSDEWLSARLESRQNVSHTVSLLHPTTAHSQIIGVTGAHSLPEIGYVFLPSAWGRGYATEALDAWVKMYWSKFPNGHPILDEEEKQYLKALTGPGGDASRSVLRKCGFQWYADRELAEEEKGAKEKGTKVTLSEFRLWRSQPP